MSAKLVIPIEAGPKITQAELNAFIERQHALGRDPDEELSELIVEAIRNGGKAEGAGKPAMAA